jgi:CP family cyanate transporter-like MFS transporter
MPITEGTAPDPVPERAARPLRVIAPWYAGLAILAFSANLRTAIVGISPLLVTIRADTGISATVAGLLTAVPVICFGIFSPVVPTLGRRYGMERSMFVALIVLMAGILLRLIPSPVALFAGTFVIGAAVAVGNVLLSALIKKDFPTRVGLLTGLYTMTLSAGAGVAASVVVPLMDATGWGWREILALMAIPVAVAVVLWLPLIRLRHRPTATGVVGIRHLLGQPLAWWVTLFLGFQSFNYYALTSWLPEYFVSAGLTQSQAGLLLALTNIAGIPGSLLAPLLAARLRSQALPIAVAVGVSMTTLICLIISPVGFSIPGMILLGVTQGALLGLALLVIVQRTATATGAADMSGMAQSAGYLLAALGPIVVGALHDVTHAWLVPMLCILVFLVPLGISGVLAGRHRTIPGS